MALGTKTRGAVMLTRTYSSRTLGRKRVVTDAPGALEEAATAVVAAAAAAAPACCGGIVMEQCGKAARKKRASADVVEAPCYIALLPQDLLVRILCGVHHSDLEQLVLVSKAVREAALIAKKVHFAFSTPVCKPVFSRAVEPDEEEDIDGVDDAPNAPRRSRKCESKLDGKRIDSLVVALFADDDDDDDGWSHQENMLIDF